MLLNRQTDEKIEPKKEREWHFISAHNIPGLREEPFMPPQKTRKMWGLLWYTRNDGNNIDKYWSSFGQTDESKAERDFIGKNKEVKKVVATLTNPGDDQITKARKLYDFIGHEIHNLTIASESEIDIGKLKDIIGADDVLKAKFGDADRINLLYVSMLQSAGLDAHVARLCNRATDIFRRNLTEEFQFTDDIAAIKGTDGKYTFYDPGTALAPFGYIAWEKQWVWL